MGAAPSMGLRVKRMMQHWTWVAPLLGWLLLGLSTGLVVPGPLLLVALIATVLAAV